MTTHNTREGGAERVLPTNRTAFPHQLTILSAAVRLSGPELLTIRSSQVATEVDLGAETVTECLRFFGTVGLVTGARGRYAATVAGITWAEVHHVDTTRGRLALHGLFRNHWSAKAALTALTDGPVSSEALAQYLGDGLPGAPRRASFLVDWLVEALVIHRDRFGRVHAPANGEMPDSLTLPPLTTREPVRDDNFLLGMSTQDLKHLSHARYVSLLDTFVTMLDEVSTDSPH
ncbi:hypothetical protein [Streptomyces lichenis]|uniref:Uncharacterized protein n=1 Tax=Streptomyces lichenis TaxID=2306967 RepID=A0ABT0I898_9ACTN|nr:hypothetical protein [Streptomyces lichenis]MCK8677543.1 hypothetical protein [Streptomyces lichenis]